MTQRPQSEAKKQRAALQRTPLAALQRKYRSQGTLCVFQAGGDALPVMPCAQKGCERFKVLPGHALEMFGEEAQVKPQLIL